MDERLDDREISGASGCIEGTVREVSLTLETRPYATLALAAAGGFVLGGKLLGQVVRGLLRMVAPMVVDLVVGFVRGARERRTLGGEDREKE